MSVQRARELVLKYGWNATAYQIVNPGISHWFSKNDDAMIGYVRKCGVRVVAGAPVCAEEQLTDVVDEWEQDTQSAGDKTCYFGAAGRIKTLLAPLPEYSTVSLGAQPVWDPANWESIIRNRASLRAQLSRARNKNVTVSEWPPQRATQHPELRRVLDEWLQTRGLPTLHFLVEPETLALMEDRRTFVAEQNGKVVGFTVLCPITNRQGWLTEQFPRGKNAPNGTVELLMDAAISTVASEGARYVTMGLVPLSEYGREPGEENPPWLKVLLAWVRAHGRRFYNFGGLENFKAKFAPDYWEAIYAISNERHFSIHSLYAISAAFTDQSPLLAVTHGLLKAARQEWRWATKNRFTK
jgi:phosphatidylglycerol lysyltransferase